MTTKDLHFQNSPIPQQRNRQKANTSASGTLRRVRERTKHLELDKEAEEELLFLTDISRPHTTKEETFPEKKEDPLELSETHYHCNIILLF